MPSNATIPNPPVKVLLVEDNASDALLLHRLLGTKAPSPYEVTHHDCMADAARHVATETMDIVLLDLGLPDANGLEAVRQMLAAAPRTPVVVMTGFNDEQLAAQALRAGAQDFLVKGELQPSVVIRALRYAMARKALEEQLFHEQERAQITLNAIADAVICIDHTGAISFLNRAAQSMTGLALTPGDSLMSPMLGLTGPDGARIDLARQAEPATTDAGAMVPRNASITRPDGRELPVEYTVSCVRDRAGAVIGSVFVLRDMTETRALADKLAHMAQHDALTGLPNRLLLADRIKTAIAIAPRRRTNPGVLFLDLDGFKHVNDSLGHSVGDKLLQSVARRLSACVRASDTVSRLGGDEFVVLLAEIAQPEDASIAAGRMLEAVSAPHRIDAHELHISTSIGVSLYPSDGTDAETLIRNADTAMYQAKESGRKSYRFFEPGMNLRVIERRNLEAGLRLALERQEFVLHYQPKLDIATGRIHGAEALIRWVHPLRGNVPPNAFISVAEESGLIVPLGKWVLHEACRQAKIWSDAGAKLQSIAVNVSAIEFQNEHFMRDVFDTLEATGLAPETLELELTESVLMKRSGSAAAILKTLRAEGVRLAIDDFGTGYSSLSYLTRFPVDTLKIDQSFIRQITETPSETAIVKAVLSMAQSLNLRVVAEGVETRGELEFLQTHLCDEAQGYYFSRPLPAEQFEAFLHDYPGEGDRRLNRNPTVSAPI
jgi:diguanylate cyclase (GGDEF)-like protein/PAS domain S-box-containing protein